MYWTKDGGIGKSPTLSNNLMLLRRQRADKLAGSNGEHPAFVLGFFKKGTLSLQGRFKDFRAMTAKKIVFLYFKTTFRDTIPPSD